MKPKGEASVFALDVNRLDEEFAAQPKRMKRYCTRLADAKLVRNRAKTNLKVVKAEVLMEVRRHPEKLKLDKVTESVLEACVQLDTRTRAAEEVLNVAEHSVDILEGAVDALKQKKDAISGEITLWSMSYFASPKTGGEVGREAVRKIERNRRPTLKGNRDG